MMNATEIEIDHQLNSIGYYWYIHGETEYYYNVDTRIEFDPEEIKDKTFEEILKLIDTKSPLPYV